ncbi:MAG: hypothetical protein H0U77_09630 [Nocardioidaceae bacterium]|nr:hypothetical protein [Nocardioidaceae bacterium]
MVVRRGSALGRLTATVLAAATAAGLAAGVPSAAALGVASAGRLAAESDRGWFAAARVETASLSPRTGRPAGDIEFGQASLSADGRFVLFVDNAGDASGERACRDTRCLLLRDRRRDVTTVVSARSDGTAVGSRGLIWSDISGDSRLAAFNAEAYGLGPPGRRPEANLFVKHLRSGRLEAIAAPPDPAVEGTRLFISVRAVSEHGRFVGVRGGSRSGFGYPYLFDRGTGTWTRLPAPDGESEVEAMNDNGRYVAVESSSAPEGGDDLFVYDRRTGQSRQVPPGPARADASIIDATFSGDGRLLFVTWNSYNPRTDVDTVEAVMYRTRDLGVADVIDDYGIDGVDAASTTGRYIAAVAFGDHFGSDTTQSVGYDRRTDTITLVSRGRRGQPANFWSYPTDISADGQTVLFNTAAGNIAPEGDDRPRPLFFDAYNDVFVTELFWRR